MRRCGVFCQGAAISRSEDKNNQASRQVALFHVNASFFGQLFNFPLKSGLVLPIAFRTTSWWSCFPKPAGRGLPAATFFIPKFYFPGSSITLICAPSDTPVLVQSVGRCRRPTPSPCFPKVRRSEQLIIRYPFHLCATAVCTLVSVVLLT